MATITASGSGSGIDVDLLVKELTAAERKATDKRLDVRETQVQADVTAYNSLKGALTDLQKSLSGLTTLREVSKRTATSSDTEVFTATAGTSAVTTSSEIQVDRLAQAHKLVSGNFSAAGDVVGTGTLTLSMNGNSFSINVVDAENDTLADIRDAINESADNPGIKASILTVADPDNPGSTVSKLMLTAEKTGEDNAITVSVTDDDGDNTNTSGLSRLAYETGVTENLTQVAAAQDARIFVDGFEATSSTNTFTGVIDGVSITAVSADPGNTHTLNVGVDSNAVKEKVSAFVDAYNTYKKTFDFLTKYDAEAKQAGLLTGDSAARSVETAMNRVLASVNTEDTGDYSALATIGITRSRSGEMQLDSDMLSEALTADFDSVANLLAGEGGIMTKFDDAIDQMANSSDGMLTERNKTLQEQLKDIDDQRAAFELRMTSFTDRIREQFTTMDIIVAQFKNTGDFLTQQLDSLNSSKK
jgi:flagellar hook-associated protein 2